MINNLLLILIVTKNGPIFTYLSISSCSAFKKITDFSIESKFPESDHLPLAFELQIKSFENLEKDNLSSKKSD